MAAWWRRCLYPSSVISPLSADQSLGKAGDSGERKNIGFQLKTRFSRPDPENADKMDSFVTGRIGRVCMKKHHPLYRTHFRNHKFTLLTFRRGDVSFLRCF